MIRFPISGKLHNIHKNHKEIVLNIWGKLYIFFFLELSKCWMEMNKRTKTKKRSTICNFLKKMPVFDSISIFGLQHQFISAKVHVE